ncbi:MAG: DUF2399 domain-containing protein, partial [Chloroflexia bacterium]|nr:DUF2399 domain-containing protein [Chloroflexia bacterium]
MKPPTWIAQLAHDGAVAYSQISRAHETLLTQLRALRLVEVDVQGSRRRVIVREPDGFAEWLAKHYPDVVAPPVPGQRAANIARVRNSKSGLVTHTAQPLLLRWFSSEPASPWAELTRRCGMIGITSDRLAVLDLPDRWTLLTVENWESFLALDDAPQTGTVIAIFTGGNIAETTLQALAALRPAPGYAVHFGDYDWSGLAIYRRIRAVLPQSLLHVPADLATLFHSFANHELLQGHLPLVAREDDSSEVRAVIALIAQYNAGLEQE